MEKPTPPAFVYRISTADEWAELQRTGATLGGDLDRSTGCIHLSDLGQVKMTLKNFFLGRNDLYLLQIDTSKLADGIIYEESDDNKYFPHFYGPGRSFVPLKLDAVVKTDKIELENNDFTCSLLDGNSEEAQLDHEGGMSFVNVEFVGPDSIPADELAKDFNI